MESEDKKYEITDEVKSIRDTTGQELFINVYRIKAIKDFGYVKAGRLGGFVQHEGNLSQHGDAWIGGDACVYGNAKVFDNATVCGKAVVHDDTQVWDNALISGRAKAYNNALIYGKAHIYEDANVYGDARIYDTAKVYGKASIRDDARVSGSACVHGNAKIYKDAYICNNAEVYDNAQVYGNFIERFGIRPQVFGNAKVYGNAQVYDAALVSGNTEVYGTALIFDDMELHSGKFDRSPFYIRGSKYPVYVSSDNTIRCGCQEHTWEEWHKKYRAIARLLKEEALISEYVRYFNQACEIYGHQECMITL